MRQRVITGIVAGVFYLAVLWLGSLPFAFLVAAIAAISYLELADMNKLPVFSPEVISGGIAVVCVVIAAVFPPSVVVTVLPKFAVAFVFMIAGLNVTLRKHFSLEHLTSMFFYIFYISVPFYLLVRTRLDSLALVLFIQFVVWATDSGAYFIGRWMGRNKLAPHISPNKTREGALGGVVTALAVAAVFQCIVPHLLGSWLQLFLAALLISVFSQIGDLAESAMKRLYGVKDSGTILPGHGGMLDRFDSMLFVLPVLFVLGFIR